MSFVLPKVHMLQPMLSWGEQLLENPSLSNDELKNFKESVVAHGLVDDAELSEMSSALQSKVVNSSLSDTLDSLIVNENNENEQNENGWSDYDSDDTSMKNLNASDISEHLETVSSHSRTRLRKSQTHRLNVRRTGRMRK